VLVTNGSRVASTASAGRVSPTSANAPRFTQTITGVFLQSRGAFFAWRPGEVKAGAVYARPLAMRAA